jgi:hypothetical protein
MKNTNATIATTKKVNAKGVTTKKETVSPDTKKKIVDLNLSSFADKLKNVEVKEKKDKETIYNYPENFTKAQINGEQGKKHRNKLRTKMQKFENNIFVFTKTNNVEELQKTIKEFDVFYKENYRINDYSLKSISSSNDETKSASLKTMLEIITSVKNSK